jgi:nucleotide-binding universal stress UspA family protein
MKQKSASQGRRSGNARARSAAAAKTSRGKGAGGTLRLETILVPIDFSPASLYAIEWAKFIARRTRAMIHFVNVHDFAYPVVNGLTPPLIGSEAEIKDQLHTDLQKVALSQDLRQAAFHVRAGRAVEQICEVASEIQADLIVLSTHGRTGWERAFLGSTAEKILRHAPCPVFVARERRTRRKAEVQLKKIVVPVDFSECAARGLDYAIGLAQAFRARLALINVIQLHHDLPPVVIYSQSKINRWAREVARAHMADLLRATNFGGVKVETEIKIGSPAQKVCRYASKAAADLIVTSTHGRTGLPHVFIGSVAEHMVRYAKLPVLVVPVHEKSTAVIR